MDFITEQREHAVSRLQEIKKLVSELETEKETLEKFLNLLNREFHTIEATNPETSSPSPIAPLPRKRTSLIDSVYTYIVQFGPVPVKDIAFALQDGTQPDQKLYAHVHTCIHRLKERLGDKMVVTDPVGNKRNVLYSINP